MTVESNYMIAIATLSDWRVTVIARNCDWFIALPTPIVIGRSNCFGFGFSTVI